MSSGGFAALLVVIYTRLLAKEDFGVYGIAFAVAVPFQLLAVFGLRQAITRFIARELGAGRGGRVRAYVRAGLLLSGIFSFGAVVALAAASPWVSPLIRQGGAPTGLLAVLTWYVGASGVSLVLQGVLEGAGHFRRATLATFGLSCAQLLGVLGVSLVGLDVVRVLVVESAVVTVGVGVFWVLVQRGVLAGLEPGEPGESAVRELAWYGLPILVSSFGGFLYTKVDLLFIGAWLTPTDSADYFFMLSVFDFPLKALGAYVFVLNTEVARCAGEGRFDRIRWLFWRSERMGLIIGLGLAAAFFGASFALGPLFPQYGGGMRLMRLIAPLLVVKCVAQIASGSFLISLGRAKVMAAFTLVGGAVNVGLDAAMIPVYGLDGAVYASLVGHTVMGLLTLAYVVLRMRQGPAGDEAGR